MSELAVAISILIVSIAIYGGTAAGILVAHAVLRRVPTRDSARTQLSLVQTDADSVLRAAQELSGSVKIAIDAESLERHLRGHHA
jgi:hypothetical protein